MAEGSPGMKRRRTSLPLALPEQASLALSTQPDLMELFTKRGGRMRDLELENQELSKQSRLLKQGLQSLQTELDTYKESSRSQIQSSQTAVDMYKKEQEASEEAYRREMGRTADATARLKQAESRQLEAMDRAEKFESDFAALKGSSKQEKHRLEATIKTLQTELRSAKQDTELAQRKSRRSDGDAAVKSGTLEEMQRQLEEAVSRADLEGSRRRSLELSLAEQQLRTDAAESALRESQKAVDGSNEDIIRALRSELRSQEAEIAQARKTQSRLKSLGVMQEKLQAAEARAALAERDQKAALELQSQLSTLKSQVQAWESSVSDFGVDSPEGISEKLEELRREFLRATEKLGESEAEVRKAQEAFKASERQRAEADAALHSVQGLNAEVSAAAARFERKAALLTKEREGLQKMLASYSAEAAANAGNLKGEEDAPTVKAAKTEALEIQVSELHAQLQQLEDTVTKHALGEKRLQEDLADAIAKASSAEAEKNRASHEIERLTLEVNQLQDRVNKGEFNTATTRVLHYVLNPEAEARREQQQARIEELEGELTVLKVQLQKSAAAQPSEGTEPEVASPAAAVLEAEILVLQQKVAELTKRENRLKDVFQKQVSNFREAVYLLFGYRVDMAAEATSAHSTKSQSTSFVLRPQHADSSRMQLIFRLRSGRMELVPSEYTEKKLKREVETFIDRFNSIPAFTANWTMELFQKQTQH